MRDFKFRAWLGAQMVKEPIIYGNLGDQMAIGARINEGIINFYEDGDGKYVLMQSTGLKDKNGVEIYEGDIVKVIYEEGVPEDDFPEQNSIHTVVWCDDYPAFDFQPNLECESNGLQHAMIEYQVEVIGNIYENPELIKQFSGYSTETPKGDV